MEIFSDDFLENLFFVLSEKQKETIVSKSFEILRDESQVWRIKYIILESKVLINLKFENILFYFELFQKLFENPE